MAAKERKPEEIAASLDRQARILGVAAMIFGAGAIAFAAWLLFATELGSIWALACVATTGLLSMLAGYQKLRSGHQIGVE